MRKETTEPTGQRTNIKKQESNQSINKQAITNLKKQDSNQRTLNKQPSHNIRTNKMPSKNKQTNKQALNKQTRKQVVLTLHPQVRLSPH